MIVARKPHPGTVAGNVLRWGTGALNIAACKVAATDKAKFPAGIVSATEAVYGGGAGRYADRPRGEDSNPDGRWPANLVFTHSESCDGVCADSCPVGELDRQSGVTRGSTGIKKRAGSVNGNGAWADESDGSTVARPRIDIEGGYSDAGGASRFYPVFRYQAKAPASERPRLEDGTAHETVKPLGFISWAVRLVCPPGGTVLDMFCGSGVTGEAAIVEGFRCILIDQDPKSAELTRKRLDKPIQPVMFGLDAS